MTAGQIRHRDLLTRPDNTVSPIARRLSVSRATICKYVLGFLARTRPAAALPHGQEYRGRAAMAITGRRPPPGPGPVIMPAEPGSGPAAH
jgi:hypothetical protein